MKIVISMYQLRIKNKSAATFMGWKSFERKLKWIIKLWGFFFSLFYNYLGAFVSIFLLQSFIKDVKPSLIHFFFILSLVSFRLRLSILFVSFHRIWFVSINIPSDSRLWFHQRFLYVFFSGILQRFFCSTLHRSPFDGVQRIAFYREEKNLLILEFMLNNFHYAAKWNRFLVKFVQQSREKY